MPFGPISALGAKIKSSKYNLYSSGLIFTAALTSSQNSFLKRLLRFFYASREPCAGHSLRFSTYFLQPSAFYLTPCTSRHLLTKREKMGMVAHQKDKRIMWKKDV